MITSKHLSISIVLLGISIFCTAQEVKIEFSYDKPNNSLTLILTNNTDKEILIMNQGRLSEFSGSYIVLTEFSNGKSSDLTICLFTLESGKWILHKGLSPKGREFRFLHKMRFLLHIRLPASYYNYVLPMKKMLRRQIGR